MKESLKCEWSTYGIFVMRPSIKVARLFFFGPYLWHTEVPRPGVESELHLPAYTIATRDQSHLCDLHHSSWQ